MSALAPLPASPRSDATRAALVAAGLDLFGRRGFEATSTREIAAAAGVNLAAIAYHFGSKDGLRLACADFIAARTLAENMEIFERAEVTANPVYEIDQLIEDPHVHGRGVLVEAPDHEAGSVLMHNIIPRLSETPGRFRNAAPGLGQHSRAILESIGVPAGKIDALAAAGTIKEA